MIYFFSLLAASFLIAPAPGTTKPGPQKQSVATASSIVTELESVYLKGEGISATFSLGAEKQIKLLVALHSQKYKLETSQETVINDGTLVHRFNKGRNEVILDYAKKKNAAASSPVDLFNFSSNYTAKLLSSKNNRYSLELTPKATVEELYKQAEITSLVFDLKRNTKNKSLEVVSITANSKGAKKKVTNVSIKSVASLTDKHFNFSSPKNAKVIDLTEE